MADPSIEVLGVYRVVATDELVREKAWIAYRVDESSPDWDDIEAQSREEN